MLPKKSVDFLEKLLLSSGPSGFEEETASVFASYLKDCADDVRKDVTGNTISVLNPKSDFKVMMAGHYDEIGFQAVHISDEGLIYFRNVGGIDKLTIPGIEVDIITAKGKVRGVIGKKPIHLLEQKEKDVAVELKNMWMDIGAENKKEAEKIVSIGDPAAFRANFTKLGKNRIMSKGMDDKIGAFVVAETFRELVSAGCKIGIYCVGTVQEELGLRGATTSAFGIAPNVGFAVDVTFSTDTPDLEKKLIGDIRLGSGPVLSRNADTNSILLRKIKQIASKKKIKFQEEAGFRASGGTDTSVIQLSRSGVATALVSIPNRYMHTPVEVCDLRDVEGAIKLLKETILSLKPGDTFIPGEGK
jgi:endoglucanase